MTKIDPTSIFAKSENLVNPVFVQPTAEFVNPADLRDGLGWFMYGIAAHVKGKKLDEEVLDEVRDVVYALRRADIMLLDPMHTVYRKGFSWTLAFSLMHPYGFKLTLIENFGQNDRIIINDNAENPLTIGKMYK